ncbi:MAG: glycosyltransferase [Bacteroidota bacterium]
MIENLKNRKVAILSVTNDLTADQRVHKVALTLIKSGFSPLLVGRKLSNSLQINERNYGTRRLNLFFTKGALFYAEYNIRLFLFLLFQKSDLIIANDLDTLLASFIAYKIKFNLLRKNVKLVYDSHELFTEVPELNGRAFAKKSWLMIEQLILPRIKHAYTVCYSISNEYKQKYGIEMQVVRNIPPCSGQKDKKKVPGLLSSEYAGKKIILYQGALNIGRGVEHVIHAMEFINNAIFIIIGDGDIANQLKNIVTNKKMEEKVRFLGKIPFHSLSIYTKSADVGIVLQEDLSLSYRYVLPNRLFDYIHAELPMIASNLPEIKKVFSENKIGLLVSDMDPENLAKKIDLLLNDPKLRENYKKNLKSIKKKYCWEKEEEKLIAIFTNI